MTGSLEEQQKHRDAYTKPPCDEKVETGVLQLQVKGHNGLPVPSQLEEARKDLLAGFRRRRALPTPWLLTLSLQHCERIHVCHLRPPSLGHFESL